MEDLPRAFKGIWIPREIWLHPELSAFDKVLWAEIDSLDHPDTGCIASNAYLVKVMQVSERALQVGLERLRKQGLLKMELRDGNKRILRSSLKISPLNKTTPPPEQNNTPPCRNLHPPQGDASYRGENSGENSLCPPPSKSGRRETGFSKEGLELAQELEKRILASHPAFKRPKIENWASDMDKAMKIDCRAFKDLMEAIRYAFEDDPFWVNVLQSADGLRRNFDKIWAKRNPSKNNGARIQANLETAIKIKNCLGKANILLIYKASVTNQESGDSVSLDLPEEAFLEILIKWTGVRVRGSDAV